jgi:hypothetical protein
VTKLSFHNVGADGIRWPFDGQSGPHFVTKEGDYNRQVRIDPFPCYAHDESTVISIAHSVAQAFPMPLTVAFYLPEFESLERTNGWTQFGYYYNDEIPEGKGFKRFDASILLNGKRIPLHPAMTRYLVAHEYGHVVEHFIAWEAGEREGEDRTIGEYAKLRGVNEPDSYGGKKWHATIGEMFANDFRILVCNVEPEFWPHPGFARPEQLPQIVEWWNDRKARVAK